MNKKQMNNSKKIAKALLRVWDEWLIDFELAHDLGYFDKLPQKGWREEYTKRAVHLMRIDGFGNALVKLTDAIQESWEYLDKESAIQRALHPELVELRKKLKQYYQEGYKRYEAAKKAGIPEETAKYHYKRMGIRFR